jgi:hypothetical protein
MKKNIVLIDLNLTLIKSIYVSKKVNIEFLITEADDAQLVKIKDLYNVKNIITRAEFNDYTAQKVSDIDYKIIEQFKASQLNSEHDQDRWSTDSNLKQYNYFNGLFFWISVFTKNNISAIMLDGFAHGANYDSLALDVAKAYGVSGYVIENHRMRFTKVKMRVRSVLDYNLNKVISLDMYKLGLKLIDIDKCTLYVNNTVPNLKKKRKSIKDIVKSFLPPYAYAIAISLIKIMSNKPISMHSLNSHPSRILKNIYYVRKMRKFYDSVSVEFDESKKYVFYAMHFDPEASTMARACFSNQLSVIKQLSQSLPEDWILYVKEHPDQFKFDRPGWWYFLLSIHKYRTKDFYKELLNFNNVKLLNHKAQSQNIIKDAQAISTINGTITTEALTFDKPLMLFGHQSTPFGLCKDIFKITSSEQCKKAMEQIKCGFTPDYSDFNEIVEKHFFEMKATVPSDIRLLVDYLVCKYNPHNELDIKKALREIKK